MCTAITLQAAQGIVYFGRTMDFSYPLEPELYVVPKGYEWSNCLNTHKIRNQYRFMGIGQNISPVVFADGVNEMGFAMAVLYFPGYAQYDAVNSASSSGISIAALELAGFLLGLSASVEQAAAIIQNIRIVGMEDRITQSVAPLHWIMADQSGACMVIEKTAEGLTLMNNPIGVLSNSPNFSWHMTNLCNYMNVTPGQQQRVDWSAVRLTPFGQGGGTFGLPGDYTPPARFVRTAYQKSHVTVPANKEEAIITGFHLLEGVSIPKGVVITERGTTDYTQYTAFMDLTTREYFFKTYTNNQIMTAKLPNNNQVGSHMHTCGKLNRAITFGAWNC